MTEAMYDLEPALAESDYTGAFAEVVARFRKRTMLVLLTDLVDAAVTESLLPALPLITRTHLVVVAAVRDPDLVRWSEGRGPEQGADSGRTIGGDDDEAAYRSAAAVMALEARRRSVAALRARGATVIDAPPGRLANDLADAYLLLKSTGRL